MNAYRQWRTLREIDLAAQRPKGSGFRAFKRMKARWHEGRDFLVLDHEKDAGSIGRLRDEGRIYAGSVNVVLLSGAAADTLLDHLATAPSIPR
jgi:hypothetical protein